MQVEKARLVSRERNGGGANEVPEVDSGATAVAIAGLAHTVYGAMHAGWLVLRGALSPLKALLVRLHYETWVKKMLMLLLVLQLLTFFTAIVYYVAVTAATFDEAASVLHLVFACTIGATTALFVSVSIALTGSDCHPLIESGQRAFVGKRFTMNTISVLVGAGMLAVAITSAVIVGFSPEFGFAGDDDTDVFDGLEKQSLGGGFTLDRTFDASDDALLLDPFFDGNVVSREDFDHLLRTRFMNFIMLLFAFIGLHNIVVRADIYLLDEKLVFVRAESLKYVAQNARSLTSGKAFVAQRARQPDVLGALTLNAALVACAVLVAGAMVVTALFPRNLTVMLSLTLSIVGAAGAVLLLGLATRTPALTRN
jgi:hypothetical protein